MGHQKENTLALLTCFLFVLLLQESNSAISKKLPGHAIIPNFGFAQHFNACVSSDSPMDVHNANVFSFCASASRVELCNFEEIAGARDHAQLWIRTAF